MAQKFVDLRKTPAETSEDFPCVAQAPAYPYGMCISLCEDEIEKLGLDEDDLSPGDILHLHAFALVTSVSKNATVGGDPHARIEMQLTHAAFESEDEENEEADDEPKTRPYF